MAASVARLDHDNLSFRCKNAWYSLQFPWTSLRTHGSLPHRYQSPRAPVTPGPRPRASARGAEDARPGVYRKT